MRSEQDLLQEDKFKEEMKYFMKNYQRKGKEAMNFIEKVLSTIASLTVETTSLIGYYEPKIPKELVKSEK